MLDHNQSEAFTLLAHNYRHHMLRYVGSGIFTFPNSTDSIRVMRKYLDAVNGIIDK